MASTPARRTSASPHPERLIGRLVLAVCVALLAACGHPPTSELDQARSITLDSAAAAALARRPPRTDDSLVTLPLRQLAPDIYAVLGDTGRGSEGRSNAGFVVTRDGVLVIDALASPAQARALRRTIASVTPRAVRWLLLTHHHPDHTFGAIVFRREGARILAHPDRRTLANEDGDDAMVSAWTGVLGLREMQGFELADTPDVPITRDTTLLLGERRLVIGVPGPAHTPGDLTVWLPEARVLFAGDLLIEDGITMMVDGNSGVLLRALDTLAALQPARVVPGHGRLPERPLALIDRTRCYVLDLRARMRRAVADGVAMSRALELFPPPDRDRPVSRHSRMRRNAVRVYSEMEHELMSAGPGVDSATEARALARCPAAPAAN